MLYQKVKDSSMAYFGSRAKYCLILLVIFFLILLARLFYFQILRHDYYLLLSENNRIRELRVKADRGFIKDRNGLILVRNSPGYELEVIKEDSKNLSDLLSSINTIVPFNVSAATTRIRQADAYEPVRVVRGLSAANVAYFLEHAPGYQGVQISIAPIRSYLDKEVLSHVLGYLGEVNSQEAKRSSVYRSGDIIGRTGIEKQYDLQLRGKEGRRRVEVDSLVRVVETLNEEPPIPGKNVWLTIDYELQRYISDLMSGKRGAIVVLDGVDNSVLSMYSAPSYDLSLFSPFIKEADWNKLRDDKDSILLNRTIEGAYPPGSVYKILMATAGLTEAVVDRNTIFHCNGSFRISPQSSALYHCWNRSGHGDVNMHKALKVSCDVYFYNLGLKLGIDKMQQYSSAFGLGHLTGINLPNEKTGLYPSVAWKQQNKPNGVAVWTPGDTVNASIGQGFVTVTPLQMAVMISSIFNGGTVYVPRIVRYVEDPVTNELTEEGVYIANKLPIPEGVRKEVMAGLVASVEEPGGTSARGKVPNLHYGGKTGTAQVVALSATKDLNQAEIPEYWRDHSWYTGIYPANNPRYTVVVMVENGGSGGRISAPIAGQIIKKMLELGYGSDS